MVTPPSISAPMIYLFVGEDELAKQEKIQSLKNEILRPCGPQDDPSAQNSNKIFPRGQLFEGAKRGAWAESFNYEAFYAKELTLPLLNEALSRVPVGVKQRLLVIKDILRFKDNFQALLLSRVDNLPDDIILVFDIISMPRQQNPLLNKLLKVARVIHFKSKKKSNAFDLAYEIERRQVESALNVLADLFRAGEKPERILGALRYQFTKQSLNLDERLKKVDLLLAADVTIKTGKLKAQFALEMLVVRLCKLCT